MRPSWIPLSLCLNEPLPARDILKCLGVDGAEMLRCGLAGEDTGLNGAEACDGAAANSANGSCGEPSAELLESFIAGDMDGSSAPAPSGREVLDTGREPAKLSRDERRLT